ncbi:hypothetical protein CEXT_309441 [Caerostris extrusa]|uniref:Uncharacterized protein n=1 Tax=Caerostris extrusa TaxID=172846 RepID=A0AAV4RHN6_CAEEX|nr:hypothetical protein CEXT_309441 [Caerostris extrusa]
MVNGDPESARGPGINEVAKSGQARHYLQPLSPVKHPPHPSKVSQILKVHLYFHDLCELQKNILGIGTPHVLHIYSKPPTNEGRTFRCNCPKFAFSIGGNSEPDSLVVSL